MPRCITLSGFRTLQTKRTSAGLLLYAIVLSLANVAVSQRSRKRSERHTRSGRQHFPSDVLVGSAVGWLIGRYVFHKHSCYYYHLRLN